MIEYDKTAGHDRTTAYERLKRLAAESPFLICEVVTGKARLATQAKAFRAIVGRETLYPSLTVLHWAKSLELFARKVGKADRHFSMKETAEWAGLSYQWFYITLRHNGVVSSVPGRFGRGQAILFDWTDCFVAGLIGALQRQAKMSANRQQKIHPLFTETEVSKQSKPKRTPQEPAALTGP